MGQVITLLMGETQQFGTDSRILRQQIGNTQGNISLGRETSDSLTPRPGRTSAYTARGAFFPIQEALLSGICLLRPPTTKGRKQGVLEEKDNL